MVAKKLEEFGRYILLMKRVFSKPVKRRIFIRQVIDEADKIGLGSIAIVIIISFFIGAVVVIQMAINLENPFIPRYLIGYATREVIILEFSSTMAALILAGKVGSNISSEIGSMRISEQIDAIDIMGINSASYLILPKITAALIFFPLLTILSMFVGVFGGYVSVMGLSTLTPDDFVTGVSYDFKLYSVIYGIAKSVVFGFIVASVASFYGYYAKGGSLQVGKASTKSVVTAIITVLVFNLIITKLFFNY